MPETFLGQTQTLRQEQNLTPLQMQSLEFLMAPVMELQEKYHHANELRNFAESCKESMEEFLRDVFGDAEIYSINDKDKERIKEFVKGK